MASPAGCAANSSPPAVSDIKQSPSFERATERYFIRVLQVASDGSPRPAGSPARP